LGVKDQAADLDQAAGVALRAPAATGVALHAPAATAAACRYERNRRGHQDRPPGAARETLKHLPPVDHSPGENGGRARGGGALPARAIIRRVVTTPVPLRGDDSQSKCRDVEQPEHGKTDRPQQDHVPNTRIWNQEVNQAGADPAKDRAAEG
jgi:hypothetical protein